jgi:hypothetical protein
MTTRQTTAGALAPPPIISVVTAPPRKFYVHVAKNASAPWQEPSTTVDMYDYNGQSFRASVRLVSCFIRGAPSGVTEVHLVSGFSSFDASVDGIRTSVTNSTLIGIVGAQNYNPSDPSSGFQGFNDPPAPTFVFTPNPTMTFQLGYLDPTQAAGFVGFISPEYTAAILEVTILDT